MVASFRMPATRCREWFRRSLGVDRNTGRLRSRTAGGGCVVMVRVPPPPPLVLLGAGGGECGGRAFVCSVRIQEGARIDDMRTSSITPLENQNLLVRQYPPGSLVPNDSRSVAPPAAASFDIKITSSRRAIRYGNITKASEVQCPRWNSGILTAPALFKVETVAGVGTSIVVLHHHRSSSRTDWLTPFAARLTHMLSVKTALISDALVPTSVLLNPCRQNCPLASIWPVVAVAVVMAPLLAFLPSNRRRSACTRGLGDTVPHNCCSTSWLEFCWFEAEELP